MGQVDILAIFAHPDDVELAVGGTLLKLKHLGYKTGALDVTQGDMGTRGTVEGRAEEAADAAKILKLDVRENLGLPDGHAFADDESRAKLVRVLRRLKPKVIFTHQDNDPHPDHNHIVQLVRESARLASMRRYDEEPATRRSRCQLLLTIFSRDCTAVVRRRYFGFLRKNCGDQGAQIAVLRCELDRAGNSLDRQKFSRELESRSRYFGSLIGVSAGEPFYVREALNIEDPIELLTRPMNLYS